MKKNLVAMMVTVVMVAGALVGCGSKEVAQETIPVAEASVAEATVEENAVDAAASTEESVVEESVESATEEVSVEEAEASEYTRETYGNALLNSNYMPYGAFYYYCDSDDTKCIMFIKDEYTEDYDYTGNSTGYVKFVEDDIDFYNVIESLNSVEDFINDPAVKNAGQNEDFCTARLITTVFDYPEDACITEFNEVNLPLKLTIYDDPYYIVWNKPIVVDAPSSESSTQE